MPGLFGLITKKPPVDAKAEVERMMTCVKHEPFYSTGSLSTESQGLYVGWTVHRGAFSDCMPIIDPAHNRTLIFCGQNFSGGHIEDERKHSFFRAD